MAKKAAPKPKASNRKEAPTRKKAVKSLAKRPAAKKSTRAKTKKVAPKLHVPAIRQKMTKTAILLAIADKTGLSRKQISSVLDELEVLVERHVKKRGAGEFTLPGLLKIRSVKRRATKKRTGRNPATGKEIVIAPKPASIRVRITPLKRLKDMVG
jgi:nucleoid DNA-binding protein